MQLNHTLTLYKCTQQYTSKETNYEYNLQVTIYTPILIVTVSQKIAAI